MIMAGSNNYLGLTAHPQSSSGAIKSIEKYGTGCSGSRYLTGTLDLHNKLEANLAKFLNKEAVLLFSTGYQTALGVVSTLVERGDYVISDQENHASIMNACITAKGSFAEFKRFKHSDMEDLEAVLKRIPENAGKLVVTDGIFSVSGEICNLPEITRIAHKYNAKVLVDDAHSIGVIGKGGRGTASYYDCEAETDLIIGTFSKTFASLGGFVAGRKEPSIILSIIHQAYFQCKSHSSFVAAALKHSQFWKNNLNSLTNCKIMLNISVNVLWKMVFTSLKMNLQLFR